MDDKSTSVQELREIVRQFRQARGWDKDKNVKNKVISLVIEATELLEHFQWREAKEVVGNKQRRSEVVDELADVLYWVVAIADNLEIDLSTALVEKLKKGEKKYSVHKFKGKSGEKNLQVYYQLRDRARNTY